jgi:hypothetical protein
MRFVIDGNNLLHALGKLTARSTPFTLDAARRWLVAQVRAHGGEATIVFDGQPAPKQKRDDLGPPRVVFSLRASADDIIEDLIRADTGPRHLAVVSDDIRLREAARHRGCVSLRCLDYAEDHLLGGKQEQAAPRPVAPEKPEGGRMEDWADAFGGLDDDPRLGGPW